MPPKKGENKEPAGTWWKIPELQVFLAIVREVKPSGTYEWDKVAAAYNNRRPQGSVERNTDSCRNKFKGLKNSSKPTGVAGCPWEIQEAKNIQREIETRMSTMDTDELQRSETGANQNVEADDAAAEGADGAGASTSGSESDHDASEAIQQHSSPSSVPDASSGTPSKRSPAGTGSPLAETASALPQRLGATASVVAAAATAKRAKLDKQIEEQQQRSLQASQERSQLISLLLQQQQAQQAQQAQMNTFMMTMMAKVFAVPVPQAPAPDTALAPPQEPNPSNAPQ